MGIIDTIKNVADGADAVKRIHDSGKYFAEEYIAPAMKKKPARREVSIHAPETVRVNQSVTLHGTGTGMVSLYSGNHLERELYPDKNGEWYIRLYFSVPGEYIMIAKDYYAEAKATVIAKD